MRRRISVQDLVAGGRLVRGLPAFLRHPLRVDQARAIVRTRLARREAAFVELVHATVYAHPRSPYRALLAHAGCTAGDLQALVRREGVEGALRALHREGVYLTVDEFKGRRAVVRGALTLAVDPGRLQNPRSTAHVPVRTSGSRGASVPVPVDLAFLRDRAVNSLLGLDARGGSAWVKAHWQVPGGGALARILEFAAFGEPPARWFSQVDPAASELPPRYRWSARLLRWGGVLAGARLPGPEHVPLDAPLPIARWVAAVRRAGRVPHLFTFASSAVRLCQAAGEAGDDLEGAQFTVTGEPLTAARLAAVHRVGARAVPRYAVMECGAIGLGCLQPRTPDDVHLLHDLHAVVQPPAPPGLPPEAAAPLFVTSLGPTAPFVLLNASMGDQARLATGGCGCPLEALGWTAHLQDVQSHEKLTAGGMTFLDTDVVRILEERLPGRFGGGPTDYQLVEAEDTDGHPRLSLLVHPAVGPLDPVTVARAFLEALSSGAGAAPVMGLLWREAGLLCVERQSPHVTPAGKILHLHAAARSPAGRA